MQEKTCCFTGHRPEKLTATEEEVKTALEKAIQAAISDGYMVFISGMARGTDLWAAEIVLGLRDAGQPLRLLCAAPYPGFEQRWGARWRDCARRVLAAADQVHFVSPGYAGNCFRLRNEWMVDHAARVIAVYHGGSGGTRNTLRYAAAHGVPVVRA